MRPVLRCPQREHEMTRKTIGYLSGPMTGIAEHNFPKFARIAQSLRDQGFMIINPAETAGAEVGAPSPWYMRIDLGYLNNVDCMFTMPGWENSKGVAHEMSHCSAIGIPVYMVDDGGNLLGKYEVTKVNIEGTLVPLPWMLEDGN